jgi:methyl-accepting chemotaxis protein
VTLRGRRGEAGPATAPLQRAIVRFVHKSVGVSTPSRAVAGWSLACVLLAALSVGCGQPEMALTQVVEARGISADLLLQLNKATGASDRAVLADTDEASASAAAQAKQARLTIEQDAARLAPLLQKLGYAEESTLLDEFTRRFKAYQTIDDTILSLAVENTKLKAQRLSFGAERAAGDAFRGALDDAVRDVPASQTARADASVARADAAIFEIQALEARHNAERDEKAMSALEAEMDKAQAAARAGLHSLESMASPRARPSMAAAAEALGKFETSHAEVVRLSRRNTNVESTALALGRKRTQRAGCEELLNQVSEALARHEFRATR